MCVDRSVLVACAIYSVSCSGSILLSFVFFFFQAEDGIRDAQESRGLGDVYKRQGLVWVSDTEHHRKCGVDTKIAALKAADDRLRPVTVSYTHLTLPTIYSV